MRLVTVFGVVLVLIFATGCKWSDSKVRQSQSRGNLVVAALESYMQDNGQYPPSLESLVPKYLETIPQPVAGDREWIYEVWVKDDKHGFHLRFQNGNRGHLCSYSRDGSWFIDTR